MNGCQIGARVLSWMPNRANCILLVSVARHVAFIPLHLFPLLPWFQPSHLRPGLTLLLSQGDEAQKKMKK
jgi:hypothetical protein